MSRATKASPSPTCRRSVARLAFRVRLGATSRTVLGLPIGVARTVDLNRRLTDEEWERLVVQLREVFNARGRTRTEGSLRLSPDSSTPPAALPPK